MAKKVSRPIQDSKQAPAPKKELALDLLAILSPEEREAITKQAKAKVAARDIEEATDRYLKQEMARLDKELHPEAEVQMASFTPDLALYADAIRLEGHTYHHGYNYQVPAESVAQLLDIQAQTHRHEREIAGNNQSDVFYRRSRDMSVSLDTGQALAGGRPVRF